VGQGGDHQISLGKLHGKSRRYPRENLSFQLPWDATIPWACTLVGISLSENDFAFTSEVNISGLYLNQRDHSQDFQQVKNNSTKVMTFDFVTEVILLFTVIIPILILISHLISQTKFLFN
jgi:hypothetical protein